MSDGLDLVDKLILIAAAVLGVVVIHRLTRGQQTGFAAVRARLPD